MTKQIWTVSNKPVNLSYLYWYRPQDRSYQAGSQWNRPFLNHFNPSFTRVQLIYTRHWARLSQQQCYEWVEILLRRFYQFCKPASVIMATSKMQIIGKCMDMCPEAEVKFRVAQNLLSVFEKIDGQETTNSRAVWIENSIMICLHMSTIWSKIVAHLGLICSCAWAAEHNFWTYPISIRPSAVYSKRVCWAPSYRFHQTRIQASFVKFSVKLHQPIRIVSRAWTNFVEIAIVLRETRNVL